MVVSKIQLTKPGKATVRSKVDARVVASRKSTRKTEAPRAVSRDDASGIFHQDINHVSQTMIVELETRQVVPQAAAFVPSIVHQEANQLNMDSFPKTVPTW